MNEQRLTEFGEQALEYAHANYIAGSDPHQWNVLYRKKFAELIVRECITTIANDTANWQGDEGTMAYYQGVQDAVKSIRKHFGVEE